MKTTTLLILSLCCCFLPFSIFGQGLSKKTAPKPVIVSGTIVDQETKKPLEYATIRLQDVKNPETLTGGVTDLDGKFKITAKSGVYNIKIEYISFTPFEILNKEIKTDLNLGTVSLAVDAEVLDELEIVGEKTQVEITLDKKVYNVGKDLISKGGSATDVLDNVPSVSVDNAGAVSLRGNSNVRVLINGKPSVISAANALEQLPSNSIEKVEVITNPSARYQASGTAGIINIILKKGKDLGFNSSVQLNTGNPDRLGGSINLNYNTKKVKFFSTTNILYADFIGESTNYQRFINGDDITVIDQKINEERNDWGQNIYLGSEFILNDKSSLTTTFYYGRRTDTDERFFNNFMLGDNEEINEEVLRKEDYEENREYYQATLNYTKKFKKENQKLTIDFQYGDRPEFEGANITENNVSPNSGTTGMFRSGDLEGTISFLAQADYEMPIGKSGKFETGYRGNYRKITSDYLVEEMIDDEWSTIRDLDNLLTYTENIQAFYVQYGNKINKFSYLLGLRTEISDIDIHHTNKTTQEPPKNYTNFFPTVHLTYAFNKATNLQLSYSKRITRPWFYMINPFNSIANATTQYEGNSDINPMYTNSVELGFLKHSEKFSFNPSIYYQYSTDIFAFARATNDEGVIITSPINLDNEDRFGVEITGSYSPNEWWKLSGDFNFYKFAKEGTFNGQSFDNKNHSWFARITSNIKLPAKVNFQTRFSYRGPSANAQSETKGQYFVNIGINKDIFNDKGMISFNVRDLFNTRIRKTTTIGDDFYMYQNSQRTKRMFTMSLTYRFNQKKNHRQRRMSGGGGD